MAASRRARSSPAKLARKPKSGPIVHQAGAQLYARLVEGVRQRIRTAQIKVALAANAEMVLHYWEIGRDILTAQKQEGWGARVIDRLADDLQRAFPKLSGYSARNLKYMRAFTEAWPDRAIVQQLAAQIPWAHNCMLLDRVKDARVREFYIHKTLEHGWSRSVLIHQLDTKLHKRQGKASSNFALTLPPADSDLAAEILKDPYIFRPAHWKVRSSPGCATFFWNSAPASPSSAINTASKSAARNFFSTCSFTTRGFIAMW